MTKSESAKTQVGAATLAPPQPSGVHQSHARIRLGGSHKPRKRVVREDFKSSNLARSIQRANAGRKREIS